MTSIAPASLNAALERIRAEATKVVTLCDEALAAVARDYAAPHIFTGETPNDPLTYRRNRDPQGQLSDRGKDVLEAMLRAGLSDEEIAARMRISAWGVGQNRRRLMRR